MRSHWDLHCRYASAESSWPAASSRSQPTRARILNLYTQPGELRDERGIIAQ